MDQNEDGPDTAQVLLEAARDWALRTGWPTRDRDLAETARLAAQLQRNDMTSQARGEHLLRTLERRFRKTGTAALYRAVLARIVVRASGVDG